MKSKYIILLYILSVLAIVLFGYGQIIHSYYLNDEWEFLGGVYTDGLFQYINKFTILQNIAGQGRLLGTLVSNIFMWAFPLNPLPFAVTAIFFHIANALLLFFLVKKITRSMRMAFLAGIFFVSFSSYHQALDWIACMVEIPISSCFIILSLLFLSYKKVLFACAFGYIAFLFKESALYVFFLLPIFYILYSVKKPFWQAVWDTILRFWFVAFLIIGFGVIRFVSPDITGMTPKPPSNAGVWFHSIFNCFFYPYIAFAQVIVPARFMFKIAEIFSEFNYSYVLPSIRTILLLCQNIIADMLSIWISGVLFLVVWCTYLWNKSQRKFIFLSLILLFASLSTTAFYLFQRGSSYVESRYLYVPAIAVGFLLAILVDSFLVFCQKRIHNKHIYMSIVCMVTLCCFIFCMKEIRVTKSEAAINVSFGQDIKKVIDQMYTLYPTLPEKPIVYLTGDREYFGYSKHPVPFQLGAGYMTMLLYYKTGVIPKVLVTSLFLDPFGQQGYKTVGDKGFGFYSDKDTLIKEFFANDIKVQQVVGFYFDSSTGTLRDITSDIRKEIQIKGGSL